MFSPITATKTTMAADLPNDHSTSLSLGSSHYRLHVRPPEEKQASAANTGARLPSSSYSEEFPPLTHQTSPRRKGKGRKRLGPSSPPHKNPPPNASAASKNPSAAASKSNTAASKTSAAASLNFKEEPLQGRALDYNAPPFVPTGSANPSFDTAAAARRCAEFYKAATEVVAESWEQASLDEHSSNGDGFSSPPRCSTAASAAVQRDSSSSSKGSFVDDRKPAAKPDFEDDRKPAAKPVLEDDRKSAAQPDASRRSAPFAPNEQSPSPPSDGSNSSGSSSSVDAGAYDDLIRFGRKIRWRMDDDGVKWPEYSSLSVKELKECSVYVGQKGSADSSPGEQGQKDLGLPSIFGGCKPSFLPRSRPDAQSFQVEFG